MHRTMNHAEIVALRNAAAALARAGNSAGAMAVLAPVAQDIAQTIAHMRCGPFYDISWHDLDYAPALQAWRSGIVEWKGANFEGMTPGQIGLSALLDSIAQYEPDGWHEELNTSYGGSMVSDFVRGLARQVFSSDTGMEDVLLDSVAETVNGLWYDEALRRGVPAGIHTELCFVPNWDGEDTEGMIDKLALRATRWRGSYMDQILPHQSLTHFLRWVNVSSKELRDAVADHRPADVAKFRENMKGFTFRKDASKPSLVTAKQVIDIIENAGASLPVPMAHCEVEIHALFAHDMRKPMALELKRGGMHIGMHDVINGSGYMDGWKGGPVVVPAMHTGFGWVGRWKYGIDAVYGIVKSAFYCVPREADPSELTTKEVA
jgi:hypothetical protein